MRKIIHIDMDAFFASVEQRDNPALRGKPVVVGGDPERRGVVAAASYEARKFGIHSAMPAIQAYRRCPHAIFVKPRISAYREVSHQIREIFYAYTDLVEPLSLDEAYLDVTTNKKGIQSATHIAQQIKEEIFRRTGLTGSGGVSYNKFIAKVASDEQKPNGLTVITPEQAGSFIEQLPIGRFYGVGKVTEQKMLRLGIRTGVDLKTHSQEELVREFGKSGLYYYGIARGIDERPVNPNRIRKSIGRETTLEEDTSDPVRIDEILSDLSEAVAALLEKHETWGATVTLKVRYHDFSTITRSHTVHPPIRTSKRIAEEVFQLLTKTEAGAQAVRLLGVSLSGLSGSLQPRGVYYQPNLPF